MKRNKMKPVDIKSNIYIDTSKAINDKGSKFKIGDIDRISFYKNLFRKRWDRSEEVFISILLLTYVINDLRRKQDFGTFYENELRKNESKRVSN